MAQPTPTTDESFFEIVRNLYKNNQLQEVLSYAALFPHSPVCQIYAAYACETLNNEQDAIHYYEKAIKLDTKNREYRTMFANYIQDISKKIKMYEELITEGLADADNYSALAETYLKIKKYDMAAFYYGEGLKKENNHIVCHIGLADCFLQMAMEHLDQVEQGEDWLIGTTSASEDILKYIFKNYIKHGAIGFY